MTYKTAIAAKHAVCAKTEFVSDDLDEVMTLGDRIAVMHSGVLTEALPTQDWSRETIGLAMAGVEERIA